MHISIDLPSGVCEQEIVNEFFDRLSAVRVRLRNELLQVQRVVLDRFLRHSFISFPLNLLNSIL